MSLVQLIRELFRSERQPRVVLASQQFPTATYSSAAQFKQPQWSHKPQNTQTYASVDHAAADYYRNLEDPHFEDGILIRKNGLKSISLVRKPFATQLDTAALADFARTYQTGEVMYHQHPGNRQEQIRQALREDPLYGRMLARLPPEHPLFTVQNEIPSMPDFSTMFHVQALGSAVHDRQIEQRIAVMQDGERTRSVQYGLSAKGFATYKGLVQTASKLALQYQRNPTRQNHDAMTRAGRAVGAYQQRQLMAYQSELARFQQEINGWRGGKLTAQTLFDRVARNTDLEIKYRGEFGPKTTVTPFARAIERATGKALTQREQAAYRREQPQYQQLAAPTARPAYGIVQYVQLAA